MPRTVWPDPDNPAVADVEPSQHGMSYRAWVAGLVMPQVVTLATNGEFQEYLTPAGMAERAVEYADALLTALNQPEESTANVVFDLDGSLADDSEFHPLLTVEPKQWDAYFRACPEYKPIPQSIAVIRAMFYAGHHVEIWTGRDDIVIQETIEWLRVHCVPYHRLRMRPHGDHRTDRELKGQWLAEWGDNPPDMVFDDRNRAVQWWRSHGIMAFHLADHEY